MDYVVGIIIIALSVVFSAIVLPWLKEKKLLDAIKTFVEAAEKLAQNQAINKNEWVIIQLESMGVRITPFVRAAIESAVIQLDIAMGKAEEK